MKVKFNNRMSQPCRCEEFYEHLQQLQQKISDLEDKLSNHTHAQYEIKKSFECEKCEVIVIEGYRDYVRCKSCGEIENRCIECRDNKNDTYCIERGCCYGSCFSCSLYNEKKYTNCDNCMWKCTDRAL